MTPPQLKRLGSKIVRVDTEAVVDLWGVHNFWHSHKFNASAATLEQDAVEHTFLDPDASPDPGWGCNLITYFLHTQTAGRVDSGGNEVQAPNLSVANHLDALVALCNLHDKYLMLVWAYPDPEFTHDRLIDTPGIEVLRWAANRFTGEPAVIFNIQSEPLGTQNYSTMQSRFETAIDQIREEYPSVMVGFPSDQWSQNGNGWVNHGSIPNRSNLYYCPHIYSGRNDTGQSVLLSGSFTGAVNLQAEFNVPVIIGECGWGGRSNDVDISELFIEGQTRNWGLQGWALRDLVNETTDSLRMTVEAPITDAGGHLTNWGRLMRDESRAWFNLAPPAPPSDPSDPPTVTIPTGATKVVEDGAAATWVDGSFNIGSTITVTEEAPKWVRVDYTGSPSGFQKKHPDGSAAHFQISDFDTFRVVLHAEATKLADLRVVIYQEDGAGPSASLLDLRPHVVEDFGDDWVRVDIPFGAFDFGGFDNQEFNRVELENRSGGSLGEIFVHQWVLFKAATGASLEMVTHPTNTVQGVPIDPPPTVRARDADANPSQGVEVVATLVNAGQSFTTDSVTTKTTDADGLAEFDFLKADTPVTGAAIDFDVV